MKTPPVEFGTVFPSEESFARMQEPYPKGLSFLAVPGGVLESSALRMKLHKIASGKVSIVPRELIASEIASLLPEQNLALRIEFARFFRTRCKRALELRSTEVGLRFDWERMGREPAYRESLLLLLRGSFGILTENRLKLRLGVRLPGDAAGYVRLIRELLFPGLALSLECWPDGEIGTEAFRALQFYSDSFVLHPDSATGEGWSAEEIEKLVDAAGTLCASTRRIGIVSEDTQAVAAVAGEFRRRLNQGGESSC